jgi:hypothetical protein
MYMCTRSLILKKYAQPPLHPTHIIIMHTTCIHVPDVQHLEIAGTQG